MCCLCSFFPLRALPPVCLWLGQVDSICAWKTDESRRQQRGAVTERCSQGEGFLAGVSLPQEHSYPPCGASALQESLPGARMLDNKVEWTRASCRRPRCISFRCIWSQWLEMMHVAVFKRTSTGALEWGVHLEHPFLEPGNEEPLFINQAAT